MIITWGQILTYTLIFFAKILEMSILTLRTILIAKGERLLNSILGFVQVFVWLIATSVVLVNITDDPVKVIVYALGSVAGNLVGMKLEERIAIGKKLITVIIKEGAGDVLIEKLRESKYAVTKVKGEGKSGKREVLFIVINRKSSKKVFNIINEYGKDAMVIDNAVETTKGGYIT